MATSEDGVDFSKTDSELKPLLKHAADIADGVSERYRNMAFEKSLDVLIARHINGIDHQLQKAKNPDGRNYPAAVISFLDRSEIPMGIIDEYYMTREDGKITSAYTSSSKSRADKQCETLLFLGLENAMNGGGFEFLMSRANTVCKNNKIFDKNLYTIDKRSGLFQRRDKHMVLTREGKERLADILNDLSRKEQPSS